MKISFSMLNRDFCININPLYIAVTALVVSLVSFGVNLMILRHFNL